MICYGKSFRTVLSLDHNWPPRSCDFVLWGYVKDKVYANSPASIQDLKDGFRGAIEDI